MAASFSYFTTANIQSQTIDNTNEYEWHYLPVEEIFKKAASAMDKFNHAFEKPVRKFENLVTLHEIK